ncbi:NLR family CARD domain-containing protein 4-like [Acanthaster planci]|uniref:NLR family CARD domain-containing protein 4-like n=1 Tax=Acanthaster planci TaxID=133434 RepID=A0A8B7ZT87_ACAPL|nr:NLR family CARD domain-containing protein 4-like [Acanthaster planci]
MASQQTGLAGRGKTTLFDKIAYDWAVGSCKVLQKYKLLFLLKMCDLKQESDLIDAVFDQLLAEDTSIDRNALGSYIKMNSGKVLILLDGFDELRTTSLNKSSFGSILKILNRRMCRGCTVLVSTRPSHLDRLTTKELIQPPFTHVRVMGFSKEDITEYVNKFYCDEPTKAKELLTRIRSSNLLSVSAESPMLLLMMCSLWSEDSKLPETMSRFYHNAVNEIGKRKDVSEQEMNRVVIKLGKVGLQGLLSPDQVLCFKESDFEPGVLSLAVKAGILTRQRVLKSRIPHSSVQFIHKTFQEFCAALYYQNLFKADRVEFQKTLSKIVSKGPMDFENLLRFCCGRNEACTFEIIKVLQEECNEEDLSVDLQVGQLALHCFFEGQCKILPPEDFIRSLIPDSIIFQGLDNDSLNSVTYFLKCFAQDSGNAHHLAKVEKFRVLLGNLTRCVRHLGIALSAMTNLREAEFTTCLNCETIAHITKSLSDLPSLVKLFFSDNLGGTAASWGMHLKALKPLQELTFSRCLFNRQDMVHLAESLGDLPNLVELTITFNNLAGTAESWSMYLRLIKPLQNLLLSYCSLTGQDLVHVAESLGDLPNLATLYLSSNNLGGTAESWSMHLKRIKPLKNLSLNDCSLSGLGVVHVAESLRDLPNLVFLNLSGNNLGGTAASWGMHLKELKPLQCLGLKACSLNGLDMVRVAEGLKDLPNLVSLDVSGNNLGGTAALWCIHLTHALSLRYMYLDLRDCGLTDEDKKYIHVALGNLHVGELHM